MDVVAAIVFAGALILIAVEWVHRRKVALAGAVIMVLVGIVDQEQAIESVNSPWGAVALVDRGRFVGMVDQLAFVRHLLRRLDVATE